MTQGSRTTFVAILILSTNMSSARDVKRGCSVSVLYTGHLKEPGASLELGRFLYPARTPTNTSLGAESTTTTHKYTKNL
ncbi:hypothetical protein DPMN_024675 [Dreissena polymorpha]|uniref:Peptidylprolyl isomerase n=1 Tax=Dreissena polymorpha TaxID=45954 RepID=A0A9D4LPM1_DREPO|nr:hypothetical protein DPMN_024675 [Dreissena polymorpha]